MKTVTSADGTAIAFDQSGDGPPIIMAAGAFNTRATTAPLASALRDHFTVLNYDRRGRGDSGDTRPYSKDATSCASVRPCTNALSKASNGGAAPATTGVAASACPGTINIDSAAAAATASLRIATTLTRWRGTAPQRPASRLHAPISPSCNACPRSSRTDQCSSRPCSNTSSSWRVTCLFWHPGDHVEAPRVGEGERPAAGLSHARGEHGSEHRRRIRHGHREAEGPSAGRARSTSPVSPRDERPARSRRAHLLSADLAHGLRRESARS